MDKRFLYLILVIAGILVVMLAWQDSKKQQPSILDKLNLTPSPAIGVSPQFLSPTPVAAQQSKQIEPMIEILIVSVVILAVLLLGCICALVKLRDKTEIQDKSISCLTEWRADLQRADGWASYHAVECLRSNLSHDLG